MPSAVVGIIVAHMTTTVGDRIYPTEAAFRVAMITGAVVAVIAALVATAIPLAQSLFHDDDTEDNAEIELVSDTVR